MKTARKAIMAVLCVLCVIVASITGTLAYLTDDDAVVNTFTVGNVQIELDELNLATPDDLTDRTQNPDPSNPSAPAEGNTYHLLPGLTYDKDPQVHILPKSEESFVRMIVKVEGIEDLKAAIPELVVNDVFLLQNLTMDKYGEGAKMTWNEEEWPCVKATADGVYEFRYHTTVKNEAEEGNVDLEKLFTKITVPGTVDNDNLAKLANVKIVVEAHAIQAAGFNNNADTAWAAFDAQVKS